MNKKKAQEEMIGFALIVIIVAIILLILLGFYLRSPQEEIQSYEIGGFIQTFLQYTTDCGDYRESHLSVRELVFECSDAEICLDGRISCDVLGSTLNGILEESWGITEGSSYKGYSLNISVEGRQIFAIKEGNFSVNKKGAMQELGRDAEIFFTVYY